MCLARYESMSVATAFYVSGIGWLESHFNVLLGSLKWGGIQVSIVEAGEQQSGYENENDLTACLVRQNEARAVGEGAGPTRQVRFKEPRLRPVLSSSALLIRVLLPPAE